MDILTFDDVLITDIINKYVLKQGLFWNKDILVKKSRHTIDPFWDSVSYILFYNI